MNNGKISSDIFSVRSFVLYTTILAMFSEALMIKAAIDIKFFYFVVIVNAMAMILTASFAVHKKHLAPLIFLCASGLIGLLANTSQVNHFLFAIVGISFCSIYAYNFFRYMREPVELIFSVYVKFATWVSVTGLFIFAYTGVIEGRWVRLHSIMNEPAHYAIVVIPAFVFLMNQAIQQRRLGFPVVIIMTALVFSNSSIAFVGILISIYLIFMNRKSYGMYRFLGIFLVGSLVFSFYSASEEFRLRVDDTIMGVESGSIADKNLSTYALLSNAYVAIESVKANPLLGGGLGSHATNHRTYIGTLEGVDLIVKQYAAHEDSNLGEGLSTLNYRDAASLALRILSELGILGIIAAASFLYYYRNPKDPLNTAAFVYLLLKLFRDGHYFPPEMYFFVMVYILTRRRRDQSSKVMYSGKPLQA